MFRPILISLIVILLLFLGVFLLFFSSRNVDVSQGVVDTWFENPVAPAQQQEMVEIPGSIQSMSGANYSGEALLTDSMTTQLSNDGLYKNSSDETQYDLYYFEPTGRLDVQLYQEPLSLSRTLAEGQLREVLPYSDDELCDMGIRVLVSRFVSEVYKDRDLGLSFCPGSVVLE